MTRSARILAVCALVATFESPIGQSIDGYVVRHTVSWCPDYYDGPRIQIEERVVDNRTDKTIGQPHERTFRLPTKDTPAAEQAPVDTESRPMGIMP